MATTAAKGGSAWGWIVPLAVLTVLAGGGGALVGRQIVATARSAALAVQKGAGASPGTAQASTVAVKELAPVVTNLASPDGSWVRLQTAIVYDKADAPQMDVLGMQIGEDILAYLKTLTVAQLQGANGLEQLREDLNERAALRSDGRVRELMIEMLVIQ